MARIKELFPFGDLDDTVIAEAATRFPFIPVPQMAAGFDLAKAIVDAMEHLTSTLDEAALTPARWRLLMALVVQSGPDGATIGELAGHLDVREPTVTATVDRLEGEGLVVRTRDGSDRRVVRVTLTNEGAATVAGLVPRIADRVHRFVNAMGGPEDVRHLAARVRIAIESSQ